jgi:crotonobetaine/carnitine-CoA ligase
VRSTPPHQSRHRRASRRDTLIAAAGTTRPEPLLPEVLARNAARLGDRAAVTFDDATLTYRDLDAAASALAAGLARHGVHQGDLVLVVIGNRSEMATALFGLARLGALAVPVSPELRGQPLTHILGHARARHVIATGQWLDQQDTRDGGHAAYDTVIRVGTGGRGQEIPFSELAAGASAAGASATEVTAGGEAAPRPGDPWAIMYTSGTTGPAKGVVLSNRMITTVGRAMIDVAAGTPDSVWYTCLPTHHLNGLVMGIVAPVLSGARGVVRASFPRWELAGDLRRAGATITWLPPFVPIGMLGRDPAPADRDFPVRSLLTFGLDHDQWAAFEERFGTSIKSGYGPTETGLVTAFRNDGKDVIATSGRPLDHVEVAVVDEDDTVLPVGQVGEIVVRPRAPFEVMSRYHDDPAATATAWRNLWLHTGDAGSFDADGSLRFADRLKDMIKRRGVSISSYDVEQALLADPGITDAAVVAYREAGSPEEEVRAFIRLRRPADPAQLLLACHERVPAHMVPRYLDILTGELPRNHTGKTEKRTLRARALTTATYDRVAAGLVLPR